MAAWGVPRATHDLDFALALGSADPAALSRALNARFQAGEDDDPLRGVFQTTVTIEGVSIPIQLIILPAAWNAIIFHGIEQLSVFGCRSSSSSCMQAARKTCWMPNRSLSCANRVKPRNRLSAHSQTKLDY